ncbi:MAG: methyltransferase domain-containing protein [Haloarculaceae archaeon]
MAVDVPANRTVVRTYDRLAAVYDLLVARLERPTRWKTPALLDPSPGERLLDVGCGPGHAAVSIAERVGRTGAVYVLDAAAEMVSRASDHRSRSESGDRLGLVLGDARRLPFDEGTVEGVLLAQTLELFDPDDRERVLREIARILAPDGRLVVTSMERGGARRTRFVRAYEWLFAHTPYSRIGCRPIDVTGTLAAAGFRADRAETVRLAGLWPTTLALASPPHSGR